MTVTILFYIFYWPFLFINEIKKKRKIIPTIYFNKKLKYEIGK